MKKIILCFFGFFLCNVIHAQEQLTISQAIAYKVACTENGDLEGYWLDVFGKKVLEQEYINAKNSNDEFKLNRLKKTLTDKYDAALKSLNIRSIFFVTELIDNYTYDFSTSSVKISFGTTDGFGRITSTNDYDKLDVYIEGGVRRNYMTKGYESDNNPVFRISNAKNIPILFEMPEEIAEKSFAQRKGNNRPAFKLRYYFKFWQCGSDFGRYTYDVEVIKVEIIDDIVNYKKSYDVLPGIQPEGAKNNATTNNNYSNSVQDSLVIDEKYMQDFARMMFGFWDFYNDESSFLSMIDNENYPLHRLKPEIERERIKNSYYPFILEGDFDGDKIKDYAGSAYKSDEEYKYLFVLSHGQNKQYIEYEKFEFPTLVRYNELQKIIGNIQLRNPVDGIKLNSLDGSSKIKFFNGEKFEEIIVNN